MDPKYIAVLSAVISAVVGGLFSLGGILLTQRKVREQAAQLEALKARLGEEKDERSARRDYEYEARKRLYEQCEPLLFQFGELSENALRRIDNLAEASRNREILPDGSGWLGHRGYYFQTTLYRLMVPCTVYQLLQQRLTQLDLGLDGRIGTQFALCRMLYATFGADWLLKDVEPTLRYNPDDERAGALRGEQPAVYHRQGIYGGYLDRAVEALIVTEAGHPSRFLSYGEFSAAYEKPASGVHKAFAPVAELFAGFHPASRPVLWRVLLAQTVVYRAVHASRDLKTPFRDAPEVLRAMLKQPNWPDWVPPSEAGAPRLDTNPGGAVALYITAAMKRMGTAS